MSTGLPHLGQKEALSGNGAPHTVHRPTFGIYSRSVAEGADVCQSAILREAAIVRISVMKNRNKKANPRIHMGPMLPKKKNGNTKTKPPTWSAFDVASSKKPAAMTTNPIRTSATDPLKRFTRLGFPHKPSFSALAQRSVDPFTATGDFTIVPSFGYSKHTLLFELLDNPVVLSIIANHGVDCRLL